MRYTIALNSVIFLLLCTCSFFSLANNDNGGEGKNKLVSTTDSTVLHTTSSTTTISLEPTEQTAPLNECHMVNNVFSPGESLKYKIYYNWTAMWMKAGNVTFDITDAEVEGKPAYHIVAEGKTAKAFNWFFKVNDRYETYLDTTTLRPLKYIRDIHEGKYTKYNEFTFYHQQNELLINKRIRKGKVQAENERMSISSCTQDLLSAVYFTRCADYKDMAINDSIPVDVVIDGKIYDVHLRYLGKDELKTKLGKFKCVKFRPLLLKGGVFDDTDKMTIWATDDDNRLPIFIESSLSVGWAKAYLTDFEGLRHHLAAKID